jgi:glucuronate isomerase
MRICGEPERVVTGDAPEAEKWAAWTRTLPKLVGNPLFAWAKMEMEWLNGQWNGERSFVSRLTSHAIHRLENVSLADWTPSKMLKKFGVEYLSPCVGANGLESLEHLESLDGPVVVPSLRMNAGDEMSVETLEKFDAAGCRVVDISVDDASQLSTLNSQLSTVAAFAAAHDWTMLLHMGALRETSARLRAAAGPVGGFAGMRVPVDPAAVAAFLNALEKSNALPRTILMSLNPEAHAQLAVLAGSFNEEEMPGKVQLGPAWWWCDHEEGIRDVLEKNAAYGVLSTFIGMITDSRSLLSFVRHDYFRRVLCKWVAEKVATGAFPDDESLLRPLLENICYKNAKGIVS